MSEKYDTYDCTQRQIVYDIANLIYQTHGGKLPDDLQYLYNSQHPKEKMILWAAEEIYGLFSGDTPDYSDEEIDGKQS